MEPSSNPEKMQEILSANGSLFEEAFFEECRASGGCCRIDSYRRGECGTRMCSNKHLWYESV